MLNEPKIRLLADTLSGLQSPYGWHSADSPYVFSGQLLPTSPNFHSPTFMAIGLYRAYKATGEIRYKDAADRYIWAYFACLRDPQQHADFYTEAWRRYMEDHYGPLVPEVRQWAVHVTTWPFIYGMALAGYGEFRRHNPRELALEPKAAAVYDWLNWWRWDEGSYYRNGYGSLKHGIIDCANSDDICHMGRGLMGYHAVTGRQDVLTDARHLAEYFLTEYKVDTFDGCWSSRLGTWNLGPTSMDNFEHFTGTACSDMSTGFNSLGITEYLAELSSAAGDAILTARIAEKCVSAMKWNFEACQWDDGAVGLSGRDDKWLGATAGAILCYLIARDAGWLTDEEKATYRAKSIMARDWLVAHVDEEGLAADGYFKVTGISEPRPPENLAWLLGRTLQALCILDRL